MHRILLFTFTLALSAFAQDGPNGAVVLLIRHAEKPLIGQGLTSLGEQRAKSYKRYFRNYKVDSQPLHLDAIFAAADSADSHRPRLTIEPLARAMNLPADTRYGHKQIPLLAAELRATQKNKRVLICWRHGELPELLRALGAKPEILLPGGKWPDAVFDWVIQLTYDKSGRLIPAKTKRIAEHLLPGDSA